MGHEVVVCHGRLVEYKALRNVYVSFIYFFKVSEVLSHHLLRIAEFLLLLIVVFEVMAYWTGRTLSLLEDIWLHTEPRRTSHILNYFVFDAYHFVLVGHGLRWLHACFILPNN